MQIHKHTAYAQWERSTLIVFLSNGTFYAFRVPFHITKIGH